MSDLELSRLESWSRDISNPIFTSLGLSLVIEPQSLGLGTLEFLSWSWSWSLGWDHGDSILITREAYG